MKRNKKVIAAVLAAVMCLALFSLTACSEAADTRDKDILAVYSSYVAYAEEEGVTPLSYEEWLKTIKGEKGDKGDTGAQGEKGDPGEKGDTGAQGEKGDPGAKGDTGEKGEKGDTGATGRIGFVVSDAAQLQAAVNVDNAYVVLANDIAVTETITTTKNIILDLGGKTLSAATFAAAGKHPIFTVSGETASAVVINGKINSASEGLCVHDKATLTVKDGLEMTTSEMTLKALTNSTLIIEGGTYTCNDNAVIATNGTEGYGGNTIIVNGGTFNGNILSPGYIACGIYVANSDVVTVNAGTFNIKNGVGVMVRSGKAIVNGGTFNITNDGTVKAGEIGDAKVNIETNHTLVLDLHTSYPGGAPTIEAADGYEVYEHKTNAA